MAKNETRAPILVIGHPRSGTNFVSSIIMSDPSVSFLVEPFSQHSAIFSTYEFKRWERTDFDQDSFHSAFRGMPETIRFLKDFKKWLYFDTGELRIFKETMFFLQLGWLREYLPDLRVIYIERNPRGVVSSFKKANLFERWNYSKRFSMLSEQVSACDDLAEYRTMVARTSSGSWVDMLTTIWYIKTREAKKGLQHFDHICIEYEDLVKNPESRFADIFKFAGLNLMDQVVQTIRDKCRETRGAEFSTFRDSKQIVDEWKSLLDKGEKKSIRQCLRMSDEVQHGKRRRTVT